MTSRRLMYMLAAMTIITDTSEPNIRLVKYTIEISQEDIEHQFTVEEKEYLRPIAETLAMLDGNAFFDLNGTIYEAYLPEARAIFNSNGGLTGWASGASWIRKLEHETPAVEEAYRNYITLKALCQEDPYAED